MKFTFAIFNAGEPHQTLVIDRSPVIVGRSDDCDIQLDSRSVSRQHCEIKLKQVGLTIKDLGSRNGTIVNGQLIVPGKRIVIKGTDVIRIGKFTLRIYKTSSERSRDDVAGGDASQSAKQQDLLANLEEFIRNRVEADIPLNVEESDEIKPVGEANRGAWTVTNSSTNLKETIVEAISDTTRIPTDSTANDETVTLAKSTDSLEDAAESRRLEMRKRIDSMKAKDSKEAADRALKKLFGG